MSKTTEKGFIDIEAGIFSWPTTDDYPGTPDIDQNPKKKVRWISVRRVS